MHRPIIAVVSVAFGSSCSSGSTRHLVAHGDDGHDQGAATQPHHHGPEGTHPDHGGEGHHRFIKAEDWTGVFDDPARDEWQRPEDVVRALDLAPAMVVADIGAGTGYFSVRIARAVPAGEVIATDVEPDMVRFLGERGQREQLNNLRPILATQNNSGLAPRSVDRILVVDVWHHIETRVAYARELSAALRPGGKLLIVDFNLATQRGPPVSMRLAPEAIIAELTAAGLVAKLSPVVLPDQYIVEAGLAP